MSEQILEELYAAILDGDATTAEQQVQAALDAGIEPEVILNQGMIAAMGEVGRLFEEGEYFVPEMLIAARAMKAGLALLRPHLVEADVQPVGKVIIGTVKGDLHDIGKNLVALMMEGAGFVVEDLGVDVPSEKFIEAAKTHQPDIVGLSALLTTTMPAMQATIAALDAAGMRDSLKIIVGGAPVTDAFAHQIGADGYAPDANQAVSLAKSLIS
ncbi:MAG: cobalamin-binding protein [Chloroflexi bacterium]|nr:cobalamin-binding protein [Chloroflexota bacterium]